MKIKLAAILFVAFLILVGIFYLITEEIPDDMATNEPTVTPISEQQQDEISTPSDGQAEEVGFRFIQDFIQSGFSESNQEAQMRAYEALSENAKTQVSQATIGRDLAMLVGVQDIPEQGASVEDLQIVSENEATLIVGLNFSGGRTLKAINLVAENGEWKVDSIEPLEEYPPEQ